MTHPWVLAPDNFTPPSRTPWGGRRLLERYKTQASLSPEMAAYDRVGESWEVSVGPEFPSWLVDRSRTLADLVKDDPVGMLGSHEAEQSDAPSLLVKLLDAADNLSIQVHPSDAYAGLRPDQSGKPECWYILERSPGSGVYFGLRQGIRKSDVLRGFSEASDLTELLYFVPVEPGDFLCIQAGTPHAVGAGVTLVEPQRVRPGKKGVTYRFWDWNRGREVHVEDALAVIDWSEPREDALLAATRVRAGRADTEGSARIETLAGPSGPVSSEVFELARWTGTGTLSIEAALHFRALTTLEGSLTLHNDDFDLEVQAGYSAVIPAACQPFRAELRGCHAVVSAAHP